MRPFEVGFCALLLTALVLSRPAVARAAEALYLNWDDCGAAGPLLHTSTCLTNDGNQQLYCAFSLGQPLDQVIGVEIVVDVQHSAAALPPWWQLGVGGCRDRTLTSALTANGAPPGGTGCVDFWQGRATGGIQGYGVGQPRGGPNQARIKVAVSVLPADARALDASSLYYAARIVLTNQLTVGADACSGCGGTACLVLNSIWIKRLPGAPGGDVLLETPAVNGGNMALWQGSGADCMAVPVRKSTWGRIKSLYR